MKAYQIRKSTDGLGVLMWWFDNGWRIVRFPKDQHKGGFPHSYRVEVSKPNLKNPYMQAADNLDNLAEARRLVQKCPWLPYY